MAAPARSRTTPGGRTSRPKRAKKSGPLFSRAEIFGIVLLVLAVGSIPFVIDLSDALSGLRDGVARTFGLGVFVAATMLAVTGFAIVRGAHRQPRRYSRHVVLVLLASFVVWGALGLNRAEWSLGGVEFSEVTLGGNIGHALVSSWIGAVAFIIAIGTVAWMLSPRLVRVAAFAVPQGLRVAWTRRYPHRALETLDRAAVWLRGLRRAAKKGDDYVIGTDTPAPRPHPVGTFETEPVRIRPSVEPGGPASTLGAGAAAALISQSEATSTIEADQAQSEPIPQDENPTEELPTGPAAPITAGGPDGWHLPALELLNEPLPSAVRKHDNAARAQLIVDTLSSFGVDATVVEINEGPTVTQFGVEPGWEVKRKEVQTKSPDGRSIPGPDGRPLTTKVEVSRTRVRVNRITRLQNDLALALAAPSLRIEAPVPGRAIVGIEVPNDSASVVTMRGVMETTEFQELAAKAKLAIPLGKGVSGTPVVADLARMPHLLIAGATGSGKSVCMNAVISGIMMNATPDEVRFIMIDPKRVELTQFGQIPHLAFSEVVVDIDKVVGVLQAVVSEMESRYKRFSAMAVRNIESYNRHPRILKKLPYWVVVIDELADLMMAAPFEVEKLLCRLAQLARATGIHLVVATQRPSVDVITGLIKANFPTRIAFATTSQTDSRTILDMGGAEKLLGRGDMLFMPTDAAKPKRIQGVYVSDAEVERLVEFWTADRFSELNPENADDLLEEALAAQNGEDEVASELDPDDPLMEEARELATMHERISPSMIERRLGVGRSKALLLIEELADEGIIGPREEGESRRVLAASQTNSNW